MLNQEQAEEYLSQWRLPRKHQDEHDKSNDDFKLQGTRHQAKYLKLPLPLRPIALGLYGCEADGSSRKDTGDSRDLDRFQEAAIRDFVALPDSDRLRVLKIPFPAMAEAVLRALDWLDGTPYQQSFRTRQLKRIALWKHEFFLETLLGASEAFDSNILTPEWLAVWTPYVRGLSHWINPLFASQIDHGGASADRLFEILCACGRNEHELGSPGNHVTHTFQMTSRPEAWDFVEKALLEAQRDEGLRASILDGVDKSHPDAFARALALIKEHNLLRFSSVVKEVSDWFGLRHASLSLKRVEFWLNLASQYLADPDAARKAVTGEDADAAYMGLWTLATRDIEESMPLAGQLLQARDVRLRGVGVVHLGQVQLSHLTRELLKPALRDSDLGVACQAATYSNYYFDTDRRELSADEDLFEHLEELIKRLPRKPEERPGWGEWSQPTKICRETVVRYLESALASRSLGRLVPYLPLMNQWSRSRIIEELPKYQEWPAEVREMVLRATGDATSTVRWVAFKALQDVPLDDVEVRGLEGLLTRKTEGLRIGVVGLLAGIGDEQSLSSAERLLASTNGLQRLGGLELLRKLKDTGRQVNRCQQRAAAYREQHTKLTTDEKKHLDEIGISAAFIEELTLENGLGLFEPSELSPVAAPVSRPVEFWTNAAAACLKDLDDLIYAHREDPVPTVSGPEALGTISFGLPIATRENGRLGEIGLGKIWREWNLRRGKELRDVDGLELVRLRAMLVYHCGYQLKEHLAWMKQHPDRAVFKKLLHADLRKPRYPVHIKVVLDWLLEITPPDRASEFLTDCLETLCAAVSQHDLQMLRNDSLVVRSPPPPSYDFRAGKHFDWRRDSPIQLWHEFVQFAALHLGPTTPNAIARLWRLLCWWDRPWPDTMRDRPEPLMVFLAFEKGAATAADVFDATIGPREVSGYGRGYSLLEYSTRRQLWDDYDLAFRRTPELPRLVSRVVQRLVDVELRRGEEATPASWPAVVINSLSGVGQLVRVMNALGTRAFKLDGSPLNRHLAPVFTHLVQVSFPAEGETTEFCTVQLKPAGFSDTRLLQLAFLAPQWIPVVELCLERPGIAEGIYWFLAHMAFLGSEKIGEEAVTGSMAGQAVAAAFASETMTASETSGSSEDIAAGERYEVVKLTPWQQLLARRTHLTKAEREDGIVDIAWFHRVHKLLGEEQWESLASAARFASSPQQAKKAKLIGEVLLGKASVDDLIQGIQKRQLKDNVRLLGLAPLPTGKQREVELKRRYAVLMEYQRYARGLSGLTRPQAMSALRIGLRNLAATAGYADPLRLEWALGAAELRELASEGQTASVKGLELKLELDESAHPRITWSRAGKVLKSPPAGASKAPAAAELLEWAKEIKRQSSRMKSSLEEAMCRQDSFTGTELRELSTHPLVGPQLSRLVLVGDGIMGYPHQSGKALRDCEGKIEPIKKNEQLRIAHPVHLLAAGNWARWQADCFQAERIQPFKQVFRELYVPAKQELADGAASSRYAGHQVQPRQAAALWTQRGWSLGYEVIKSFPEIGLTAEVEFQHGFGTPLMVEGLTLSRIRFRKTHDNYSPDLPLSQIPPVVFSEVMRDVDLVVSVAHAGGVDPEASASTVQMRAGLLRETLKLLGIGNVRIKEPHILIDGTLGEYSVHLGSGTVHRLPGGSICLVPIHSQQRGRLFLPFADDDPRTAEVLSKVILLANDQDIKDPILLEQLQRNSR